jgi:hypothetical protein
LLVAPGNGRLSGKTFYIVAGGDVTVAGLRTTWSIVCRLAEGSTGVVADTLVNGQSVGTRWTYTNQIPRVQPQLQLSLVIGLSGTSAQFKIRLMQFEIQS